MLLFVALIATVFCRALTRELERPDPLNWIDRNVGEPV